MLKRLREMFKNEKGLTLVELLAVIVILAIVGAIAFVMIGNIIENSKKDAAVADALQAIDSAKLYETASNPEFPVSIETLQGDDFIDVLYDPWEKTPYGESAEVNKDDDGYFINDFAAEKCALDNGTTEAKLIENGRDECK